MYKKLFSALASSLFFSSMVVAQSAPESVRGYMYMEPAGDYSIVKDVPMTERNKTFRDMTIDFNSLPFSEAVIRVKGDGSRQLAVVVDPSCPHCRSLENELELLTDVTIYTFIAPVLHGESDLVQAIHCSGDWAQRGAAYDAYSKFQIEPEAEDCDSMTAPRIMRAFEGYKKIDQLTPTIIFESNAFFSKFMKAEEIEQILQQSETNSF